MKMKNGKQLWKLTLGISLAAVMAVTMLPANVASAAELPETVTQMPGLTKAGSLPSSDGMLTYEDPFISGLGGSTKFRIPSLIALRNGDLLAAADARWSTDGDGGGLDTIASVSGDGGATWNYSFPLYFPDSQGYAGQAATTIIDPCIVEGPDGTLYCFADVNPTGSTVIYKTIGTGTGYVTVNGSRYLAVTGDYDNVDIMPVDSDITTYPYYVDDFNEEGYAEILNRSDSTPTGYGVDEWYNLYTVNASTGEYEDTLRQSQVNFDKQIQQNLFYKDSKLHVYSILYVWYITSTDHGKTWEHPRDITDQIKRQPVDPANPKGTDEHALVISPGKGITISSGEIVLGVYDIGGDGNELNSSLIWSDDNGETWKRSNDVPGAGNGGFWTGENEIVELEDGTLRMFTRNGKNLVCYADAVRSADGDFIFSAPVSTDEEITSNCNISAIRYSKKINGRQAILVSCPGGSGGGERTNGKIFTYLVNEDNSMELFDTFSVPDSEMSFGYSCLTEMEDGMLALLWESPATTIHFNKYSIVDIAPKGWVEGSMLDIELAKGETYTRAYDREGLTGVSGNTDETVAQASVTEEGITILGLDRGYTEIVIDNVCYRINVVYDAEYIPVGGTYEFKYAGTFSTEVTGDAVELSGESNGETMALFGYQFSIGNSLSAFSNEPDNDKRLSDAEFTITKSGDYWTIYNEKKGVYLVNATAADFFRSSPIEMKVTLNEDQETFRICQSNDTRFVIFYKAEMNFNANYGDIAGDSDYELTLLEKQEEVSLDDILPGYKKTTTVTSGRQYLISYLYNGNVMVLYPENGKSNQTKLAKPTNKVTITGVKLGDASVIVDDVVYKFKVTDADCTHTETVLKGAIPAGCFTPGYTGDIYCAEPDCGRLLEKGEAILAHGFHNWDKGTIVKQVTEKENGEILYTCKTDPYHVKTEIVYAYAYEPLKEEFDTVVRTVEELYGLYTEASMADLKDAYEKYEIVAKGGASISRMKEAAEVFRDAMSRLVAKETEMKIALREAKTALQNGVKSAKGIYDAGQGNYTMATWKAFTEAYQAALNPAATADVNVLTKLLSDLKEAQNNLAKDPAWNSQTIDKELEQGAHAIDAAGVYEVTDAAKKEVTLVKGNDINNVKVPATIAVNGVSCKVVEISSSAFKNAKKVTKVTIGDNVTNIGSQAFSGCKKLKSVTLGANVKTIGKKAFLDCKKLSKVTLKGKKAPSVGKQSFKCTATKVTVKASKIKKAQRKKMLAKMKSAGKMSKKSVVKIE